MRMTKGVFYVFPPVPTATPKMSWSHPGLRKHSWAVERCQAVRSLKGELWTARCPVLRLVMTRSE